MKINYRQKILELVKKKKMVKSSDLVSSFGISRQMMARHLKQLLDQGQIEKLGTTRSARYKILSRKARRLSKPAVFAANKKREGLDEEAVFRAMSLELNLDRNLSKNSSRIAHYAFTEMLNNAIDHSHSQRVEIQVRVTAAHFEFSIRDKGVGVFKSVMDAFKLESEIDGLEHLIKGKQTTFPAAHSGQGIFFTSRISDQFELKSHRLNLKIDNIKNDQTVGQIRFIKGTRVDFKISKQKKKDLKSLFEKFANADFEFDRADVLIKLYKEKELVSRSQAKRLLMGLDEYRFVTLDFSGVEYVGQGFIDEIFRVYKAHHPETQIIYRNANPAVEFMIKRGAVPV